MTDMIVQSADYKTVLGSVDQSITTVLLPLINRPALNLRIQGVALPSLKFTQTRSKVKLEVFLNIFGVSEFGELVGKYLSDNKVFFQHPKYPEAGFPYKNPHIISKRFSAVITENTLTGGIPVLSDNPTLESCAVSARLAEPLEFFNNIYKSAILDEVCGNWRLKTQLLSHQRQGLYFLQRREQGLSIFDSSTIAVGKTICKIKGGILADHMGLGKTLTILSLITATLELAGTHQSGMEDLLCAPDINMRSRATLIVTPVSTLGNWEEQIATHVWPGKLRYFIYHGKNRPTDPASLCDYDVVFTTFSIVSQEWKSERDPLHAIDFYRLVLDEAHEIRAEKSQRSRSVCALTSERRWAVTGTPFQNNLTDIATLFKFLKYTPLDTKIGFQNYILATQTGEKSGMDNLRSALKAVCLRRTKATIEADLPQRTERICFLDFRSDEKNSTKAIRRTWRGIEHTARHQALQIH
ncbi:SNF2 family N-terminal domain-containing protein [Trichophaea hybrida]|nr:SNF2 family N-terminal domain-containing protein [Trichophaea hybrida]